MRRAWRLVDTEAVESAGDESPSPVLLEASAKPRPRGPARAVINDEMRYTFARPDWRLLYRERDTAVPANGHLVLAPGLPASFRGCEKLLVRASMTGATARDTRWVVGTCSSQGPKPRLAIDLKVPESFRGRTVDLWLHARELPIGSRWQRSFVVDPVPPNARLALSYGVEPAGWEAGSAAATFSVRVGNTANPLWSATLDPGTNADHRRWFDTSVPLALFAGKTITLTLETTLDAAGGGAAAISLPVWGNPMILTDRTAVPDRPWNVLLVSLDTLRAHSVGAYGHSRPTTPVLDGLAREGALFATAVAQSTLTPVSNMSLFTALYPRNHGVTDLRTPADPEQVPTWPEQLRLARYATGAITEDGLLQPALGFERGFDEYRENKSPDIGSTVGQIERTFQDALRWVDDHRMLPFFLFVHTYQVHGPYTPPPPYRGTLGPLDASEPAASRDRYEEEIQYTDKWLGRLWNGVRDLGLADRTLLIVTSDHGEEFGEHGALDHGAQLYDETLLVPLVLRGPGLIPSGLQVRAPVGLIDVLPTVLDLLKLPALPRTDGRSLTALFDPDETQRALLERELSARFIFAEAWAATRMLVDGTLDPNWRAPLYALRSAHRKVILKPAMTASGLPEKLEVYDLTADPGELKAGGDDGGARTRSHIQALRAYVDTANEPKAVRPTPAAPADPATIEKLRALGYLR